MHFDTLMQAVVARLVAERREVKIRAQFPVDAREQVQIERGKREIPRRAARLGMTKL